MSNIDYKLLYLISYLFQVYDTHSPTFCNSYLLYKFENTATKDRLSLFLSVIFIYITRNVQRNPHYSDPYSYTKCHFFLQ